jgi:periplasmic protein TonB
MATRAFLLCGDEKAVHAVTQILDELEVSFEHSSEPPFALKRLATQHFDLLVVDCDNAQNATQVFNSARASNLNKASIAIAIVEGKAGVPNAFRLGASLVLTKPVSLEQARNTLRTGIGMTRKEAPEVKAAVPATPVVTPTPVVPLVPVAPAPVVSVPLVSAPAPIPVAPGPAVLTPITPVPTAQTPVPLAPVAPVASRPESTSKPAASFAPAVTPTPVAPPPVVPVSEKPPVVSKPASVTAPAQEYKPALTDFSLTDFAEPQPKPTVGVAAFAKAAAAAASGTATAGKGTLDPVHPSAPVADEDIKPKTKISPAKAETTEVKELTKVKESTSPDLSISDPLAEEDETLDPLKDYGVPSFGGLGKQPFAGFEKPKRSSGGKGGLITAVVLVLIAGGAYGAWITQPAFRNFAILEYGNVQSKIAEFRGHPQATASAQPQPVAVPPAPAPVATAPQTAPAPGTESTDASAALNPIPAPTGTAAAAPGATEIEISAPTANPPQVNNTVADSKAQKGAALQTARQDKTTGHAAKNPALVPASLPPTTVAKAPGSDLLDVPEDYADDQVVHRVHPVYPKQARLKKLQGTVVLQAIINKQGKVDSLQLVSGDPLLAQAAADAVKQWRYKPYSHNGDFTDFQTRVTVDFKIP